MPAATQFSNYPPLYFGIVGLPTLVASGSGAVYAMRLVGDVVMAAWVALGIGLLVRFHRRPGTTIGALAALSPMAFFVMSVVNDSALEIASGFAAWCGALCVVDQDVVPRGLAFFTGASLVVFILSRPLSPLYALVVVALSLVLAGRERRRHLLRQAPVRAIGIAGAIAGGVALVLLLIGGPPSLLGPHPGRPLTLVGAAELSLRQTFRRLGQAIGDFGWIDTPVPVGTTVVWILAVGGLVLSACWASRSCRKALLVLVAVVLLSPVVFEAPRINAVGLYWQSRYWLPLLVGVPLMSVTYLRRPRRLHAKRTRPWTRPVLIVATLGGAGALFVAQLAAFLTALHRYEVGLGAPAGAPTKWTPPGGGPLLIALFTTGYVLLVLLVLSQRRQAFERPG